MKISFTLNGHFIEQDESPDKKLSVFLRENNYFSVKNGCAKGKCGSCTVLLNDSPVASCVIPLAEVEKSEIVTLEHFMKTEDYNDIEKAFKQTGINLCGFCNSGKILLTYEIIKDNERPTKEEIKEQVSFFTCNCTEIDNLVEGIYQAAAIRRKRIKDKK